jgi:putative Holliday junction resolvase|tara:strand:- start:15337 stop:15747 length:411 start_codon:yes stop_codon:yes gene_type:complete
VKRILGIDYGIKRTGIAISDPLGIIASPLETVNTVNLIDYLLKLIENEKISDLVIGLPLNSKNKLFDIEKEIKKFILKIKLKLPELNIERIDERFTSKIARNYINIYTEKQKTRRNKENLDKVSASLILQSYLEKK